MLDILEQPPLESERDKEWRNCAADHVLEKFDGMDVPWDHIRLHIEACCDNCPKPLAWAGLVSWLKGQGVITPTGMRQATNIVANHRRPVLVYHVGIGD